MLDWWLDMPSWIRILISLSILGISGAAWFADIFWPWGWGVGATLLLFSFSGD